MLYLNSLLVSVFLLNKVRTKQNYINFFKILPYNPQNLCHLPFEISSTFLPYKYRRYLAGESRQISIL